MAEGTEAQGFEGIIEAKLPKALYRVRLDDGRTITASISSRARQTTVKFIPGNRVRVALSPYDPTRGRIEVRVS